MPTIAYKNKAGKRIKSQSSLKSNIGWGKGGLMYWANQQGLEGKTLQEAYDTSTIPGTIAHYLIECNLTNVEPDLKEYDSADIKSARGAYKSFMVWRKQFEMKPLEVEPNWVSEKFQYGGTPDVIADISGEVCIVDWKTGHSAGKYPEIFIQLAAYSQLAYEHGYKIEGYHVLRVPRNDDNPSFAHFYWEKMPAKAWEAFLSAKKLGECESELKKLL